MTDAVQQPQHYVSHPSGVQMTDIAEHFGFCLGNVIKYVWRANLKGEPLEDLRKAAWYLDREIARREAEAPATTSLGHFDAAPLAEQVAALAEACQMTPAEAARRLAKALNDPVVEPLAKTGPPSWGPGADDFAPFFTPDHARYDDQHVRGEE